MEPSKIFFIIIYRKKISNIKKNISRVENQKINIW